MNRRTLLTFAAAAPLVAAAPRAVFAAPVARRDVVLLHGAFHGGWCWGPVADLLRAQGHRVFTPTFTGVGERAHLLGPSIDLDTFIADVEGVIVAEELRDIILVAHSFGGYVASGVVDRMPERIGSLVHLDAPMGTSGKSVLDEAPADVRQARLDAAIDVNGTRAVKPPSARTFGLSDPAQVAWVDRRMTPMPLRAYQTPLKLKRQSGGDLPRRFIRCTSPALPNIDAAARYARTHGWSYAELATGHDAMVAKPIEVASLLLAAAADGS